MLYSLLYATTRAIWNIFCQVNSPPFKGSKLARGSLCLLIISRPQPTTSLAFPRFFSPSPVTTRHAAPVIIFGNLNVLLSSHLSTSGPPKEREFEIVLRSVYTWFYKAVGRALQSTFIYLDHRISGRDNCCCSTTFHEPFAGVTL